MVVGAPASSTDTTRFVWQLYELTNLNAIVADSNAIPAIVKVANQPADYNNVMACYGTDGRIIFACDRPRNGAPHLYPQLDEYNDIPSNTGLWSIDPGSADPVGGLFQIDHSPSGDFHPFVDSFGRVVFTRWDHLVQDRNATDDRMGRAVNGTFNYFSEEGTGYALTNRPIEFFPEPRTYDSNELARLKLQGNAFNSFFPWTVMEDGSGMEVLNHIGRHEMLRQFRGSSFTNDPNLRQMFTLTAGLRFNANYLDNFMQIREDPRTPGVYFGTDALDFGTHAAGLLITLNGPLGTNADRMSIGYITSRTAAGLYRDSCPTVSGALLAVFTPGTAVDSNLGTEAAPKSRFDFRLVTLTNAGGFWTNEQFLTTGLTSSVSYWKGNVRVTQTNRLWELQPVEVVSRPLPSTLPALVDPIEAQVMKDEGVVLQDFQSWLRTNDLALVVSRNVTRRDRADREQPFNLRIAGTSTQTLGTNTGAIYDLRYIQFVQADQLRGLTYGLGTNPVMGRRVLASPMHDAKAISFNVPAPTGPPGSTLLGADGSQATFIPARRAMSHQLTDGAGNAVVRERYWVSYQPGEIRTCANCHGVNTTDQAGQPKPTNPPQALRDLLRRWKQQTGYAKILSATLTNGMLRLQVTAPPVWTNILEATGDFQAWQPVGTNSGTTNGLFYFDAMVSPDGASERFYRAMTK